MSDHVMGLSKTKTKRCVPSYESVWLGRWIRSNTDAKEINLPEDCHLLKGPTGPVKLKGKMVSRVLDLFPSPDSAVQSVQVLPVMNTKPTIVEDRNSIERDDDETSRSSSQSKNVKLFPKTYTNTKMLSECKRIWSATETNSRSEVKRLKTCASDNSSNENKSMMVVKERPSGQKVDYFFHRVSGTNNPGSKRYQNPSISQIKNLYLKRGEEDVIPWIQRWCKKKAAETHEPGRKQDDNSKGTALEKQFPSVAAMALMGKALRSLHPSGLRKNNSLIIWNV